MRDLCDKYLTVFADFKYVRSFFDSSAAAVSIVPDPFKIPGTNLGLLVRAPSVCQFRIRLTLSRSPMRLFQISFPTESVSP